MKKEQDIGVMGGTFDPVHEGHLAVARAVRKRCGLDRILFVPAFFPPHKDRRLTPFSHRLAMLETAVEDDGEMSVSIIEAERSGPSYTVETLLELHRRMQSCRFHLIMGADMFVEIELWYRYEKLFELADIIIAARPGISHERIAALLGEIPGGFESDAAGRTWHGKDGARVFYCDDISIPISSSEIRSRLARGESVEDYLPHRVREYIQRHGLYGSSGEGL